MLQQTQVERVIPRYLAWLERWATVSALATASPADVIREWQGLGYNRRGLNLHRAAQRIASDGWPEDLTELPGVGPYTAAAVANFALGRDVPAGGHEREACAGADASFVLFQRGPGTDGSRRNGVSGAHPSLRHLSAGVSVSLAGPALRAAAQAVAVRRLVPAKASADAATGCGIRAPAGRPRPRSRRLPGPGRPRPSRALWNVRHTSVVVSDPGPWREVTTRETARLRRFRRMRDSLVTRTARCPTPRRGWHGRLSPATSSADSEAGGRHALPRGLRSGP